MAAAKKKAARRSTGSSTGQAARKPVGRKPVGRKPAARKAASRRKAPAGRELIDTGTNKLFVRRNARGTSFKKVVDAGRSITRDKQTKARRKVRSGQGDRGDRA